MKILIVDDNMENIDMMSILLESQNYEVKSANNGREALEKLHENKYDIVISDILMPVMDGFQFCKECKQDDQLKDIYFIFYTATYIDQKDEELALSLGAQMFIRKPQEPEVFLGLINEVIQKSKNNEPVSVVNIVQSEKEIFKLYNERLIKKLEKKNLDLENEIAAHKLTEKKLLESEERFSIAVESISNGLWDWDLITGYEYHSDYYARMLGFEPDELPYSNTTWQNLLHPDDKEKALERVNDYFSKKVNNYESTFRMKTKDGKYRWIISRGKALFDVKGKPYRFIGFHEDITEKKQIADKLKESEERFRFVFEYSSVGKFLTAPDGRLMQVNNAFTSMLGYTKEELYQLNFADITHPDDLTKSDEGMRCLLTNELKEYRTEKRYFHKNGKIVWVDMSTSLLRNSSGMPEYFITSIINITSKKENEYELIQAKEKAEESDRLKTAFLSNMSHEVRTPMNGILGFVGLLKTPDLEPSKQEQFLEIIEKSCNQLLSIINDIIEISKIDARQILTNDNQVNIYNIINTLSVTYSLGLENNKNVSINTNVHPALKDCNCITDDVKLIQILTNLINNAIKFTHKGTIEIGGQIKNSQELIFYVKDTGIGIARENHKLVFERFRQVDYVTTRQYEGLGLGLSISKAYVELLGGKIWIESELGIGTTINFTIPYKPLEKEIKPVNLSPEPEYFDLSGRVVLVAEDDDNNYAFLEELFLERNMKIIRAKNGKEAVEICKTNADIELVLMDIKMPELNGHEATKQILKFREKLPIIAHTAYAFFNDRQKAIDSGCVDYISKPVSRDTLMSLLYKYLEKNVQLIMFSAIFIKFLEEILNCIN